MLESMLASGSVVLFLVSSPLALSNFQPETTLTDYDGIFWSCSLIRIVWLGLFVCVCVPGFLFSCVQPCVYILWRKKKSVHVRGLSGWPRDRLAITSVSPLEPVCLAFGLLYLIYIDWPLACIRAHTYKKRPCDHRVESSDMVWDSPPPPPTRTCHIDMHCENHIQTHIDVGLFWVAWYVVAVGRLL